MSVIVDYATPVSSVSHNAPAQSSVSRLLTAPGDPSRLMTPGNQSALTSQVAPATPDKMAAAAAAPHQKQSPVASGDQICTSCGQYFASTLMFEKHVSSRTCER